MKEEDLTKLLPELEIRLDAALESETKESLTQWIESKRKPELSTEELLEKLSLVEYKSFGFGAVMLWRMTGENEMWACGLRNEQNWKNSQRFESEKPNIALQKLYEYCLVKGYLKAFSSPTP